jgi:hypothetical protein
MPVFKRCLPLSMKQKIILIFISAGLLLSCNTTEKKAEPVTDTEVAQSFIRSTLDNDMPTAEKLLLKEPENNQLLTAFSQWYKKQNAEKTNCYKKAEIIINEIATVKADSIEIINYSNSCEPSIKNKIKLVRVNNIWQVDFKYTTSGNL